jgi:hypothetical protein
MYRICPLFPGLLTWNPPFVNGRGEEEERRGSLGEGEENEENEERGGEEEKGHGRGSMCMEQNLWSGKTCASLWSLR